jgi:hypothetical protein
MLQTGQTTKQEERRIKPRVHCDYPAAIFSPTGQAGMPGENGRVINLSSSGIYLVTRQPFQHNEDVMVKIALSTEPLASEPYRLTTLGNVIRCETRADGKMGLAIKFKDYKFL